MQRLKSFLTSCQMRCLASSNRGGNKTNVKKQRWDDCHSSYVLSSSTNGRFNQGYQTPLRMICGCFVSQQNHMLYELPAEKPSCKAVTYPSCPALTMAMRIPRQMQTRSFIYLFGFSPVWIVTDLQIFQWLNSTQLLIWGQKLYQPTTAKKSNNKKKKN